MIIRGVQGLKVIPSISYAMKVMKRNLKRVLTLMIGMVLVTSVITSLTVHVGYSQEQVVREHAEDIKIDVAFHLKDKADRNESAALIQHLWRHDQPELLEGVEAIAGTVPFQLGGLGGVVVSSGLNFTVPKFLQHYREQVRGGSLPFTASFLLAVNFSYFSTFSSIFHVKNASLHDFNEGSVFITEELANVLDVRLDDSVNVSFMRARVQRSANGTQLKSTVLSSEILKIGGLVSVNRKELFTHLAAFSENVALSGGEETAASLSRLQSISIRIAFVDYNWFYTEFMASIRSGIGLHAVQVRLNHSYLSNDVFTMRTQVNRLVTYVQQEYPDSIVANVIDTTISKAEIEMLNMQLALLYFSIPIIVLSVLFTKHANDLVLEVRKEELAALRSKNLRRVQLMVILITETMTITMVGAVVGTGLGFVLGSMLSRHALAFQVIPLALSMTMSLGISLMVTAWFMWELGKKGVLEMTRSAMVSESVPFWKRYYLDYFVLLAAFLVMMMEIIDFNPVPGFARSLYNLTAPLLVWLGVSLFLSRVFLIKKVHEALIDGCTWFFRLIWKDVIILHGSALKRRFSRVVNMTLVLTLALSFGLVMTNVTATYSTSVLKDSQLTVGSDVRIKLPSVDQLEYNSSDLKTALSTNISEIDKIASLYVNVVQVGPSSLFVVGIDPEEFQGAAFLMDDFFKGSDYKSALRALAEDPMGAVMISEYLSNPLQNGQSRSRQDQEERVLDVGSEITVRAGGVSLQLTVVDIVFHFPALSDLTGISDENLLMIIVNKKLLFDPLPSLNRSLISNHNATAFLIKMKNGITGDSIVGRIQDVYHQYFPTTYPLEITTMTDYLEEVGPLLGLLDVLTALNYGIVLAISTLSLLIFASYTYMIRRRDFATMIAVGGQPRHVFQSVFLELTLTVLLTLIGSISIGLTVSFMYKEFISSLFILEVSMITWNTTGMISLLVTAMVGFLLSQIFIYWLGTRINHVEVLREV